MTARLPWTARDIFELSPVDRLTFNGLIAFRRLSGTWRYPIAASGDLETMTRRDLIYWLYKAQFPITRASKHSGLERLFEEQAAQPLTLPANFVVEKVARLSAAGDLMDHPYLPRSSGHLYGEVAESLFDADLSLANLECVIYPEASAAFSIRSSGNQTESPALCYRQAAFDAVKGVDGKRFTFLSTANNHSLDWGEAGVTSTMRALCEEGIASNGMNESETSAAAPAILLRNGIRFGVIAHTFGLNAKKPPEAKPWIVNRTRLNEPLERVDMRQLESQLEACRDAGVDLVIVSLHWGMEHEYFPRPDQIDVAHHLAEAGVDLVIGHHPHVVQPVEHYRTKRDPERVVPIYYSLGNLVNPFSHPAFRLGGLARIEVCQGKRADGARGTFVRTAELRTLFQEIDERAERLRLVDASADKHLRRHPWL